MFPNWVSGWKCACNCIPVHDKSKIILKALDCSGNHERFLNAYSKNIPTSLFFFSPICFLFQSHGFCSLPFFFKGLGGNIANGSRRQGWMVCVGTLIICMSLQNALLLFASPGCCACCTSTAAASMQEVQRKQGRRHSESALTCTHPRWERRSHLS